MAFQKTDLSCH